MRAHHYEDWSLDAATADLAVGDFLGGYDWALMKVLEIRSEGVLVSTRTLLKASNDPKDTDLIGKVREGSFFLTWDDMNRKEVSGPIDPDAYFPQMVVVNKFVVSDTVKKKAS